MKFLALSGTLFQISMGVLFLWQAVGALPVHSPKDNWKEPRGSSNLSVSHLHDGKEANENDFPFYVMVVVNRGVSDTRFCGGAILSGQFVATAAHCLVFEDFSANTQTISIVGGKTNYKSFTGALTPTVKRYIVHPLYDRASSLAEMKDVALIEFEWTSTTPKPEKWKPIELPSGKVYANTLDCFVTGAGLRKDGSFGRIQYSKITGAGRRSIATFRSEGYTCMGDSGSPIVCLHQIDDKSLQYKIHGTVIDGKGQPKCDQPVHTQNSYYTDFAYFDPWIRKTVFTSSKI